MRPRKMGSVRGIWEGGDIAACDGVAKSCRMSVYARCPSFLVSRVGLVCRVARVLCVVVRVRLFLSVVCVLCVPCVVKRKVDRGR